MPPQRTAVPRLHHAKTSFVKPTKTERTHEENQERAYIAASRRSDRSLEARIESARRASEIHKKRTGRGLRVTEQDVMNEEMYEEEDDEPAHSFRHLSQMMGSGGNEVIDGRFQAYYQHQVNMQNMIAQSMSRRQYTNAPARHSQYIPHQQHYQQFPYSPFDLQFQRNHHYRATQQYAFAPVISTGRAMSTHIPETVNVLPPANMGYMMPANYLYSNMEQPVHRITPSESVPDVEDQPQLCESPQTATPQAQSPQQNSPHPATPVEEPLLLQQELKSPLEPLQEISDLPLSVTDYTTIAELQDQGLDAGAFFDQYDYDAQVPCMQQEGWNDYTSIWG